MIVFTARNWKELQKELNLGLTPATLNSTSFCWTSDMLLKYAKAVGNEQIYSMEDGITGTFKLRRSGTGNDETKAALVQGFVLDVHPVIRSGKLVRDSENKVMYELYIFTADRTVYRGILHSIVDLHSFVVDDASKRDAWLQEARGLKKTVQSPLESLTFIFSTVEIVSNPKKFASTLKKVEQSFTQELQGLKKLINDFDVFG